MLEYDLSHNCLGRSHLLAELLQPRYDVEIAGVMTTGEIWEPLRDAHDYRAVETSTRLADYARNVGALLDQVDGDVIYARKPRTTSYGTALVAALRDDRPVVVDVDDWESGFQLADASSVRGRIAGTHLNPLDVDSYPYTRLCEGLVRFADGVTVSNSFLQDRFGGAIVRHVRDPEQFDPSRFDQSTLRREFGLPADDLLAVFAGTPHPYKGVTEFVAAADRVERDDFKAVVVGVGDSPYGDELRRRSSDRVLVYGPQPFEDIPKWNVAADIVVIPQRRTRSTVGQLPAKLIDAMAMGRPIVTTDVSDIASVVDDAGIVVEPGSAAALATALNELAGDPARRSDLGRRARERFLSEFTYEAARPTVTRVVESVLSG